MKDGWGEKLEIKVGNVEIGSIIKVTNIGGELVFARVENLEPDVEPGWYKIGFTMIFYTTDQCAKVNWILREPQINGEQFEMGDKKMTIDLILPPIGGSIEAPKEPTKEGVILPFNRIKH
jgi:hypothetical protein